MHSENQPPYAAEVLLTLLSTDEGGRKTPVALGEDAPSRYRPHFRVGAAGEILGIEFIDGPDWPVPPGFRTWATVRFLDYPDVLYEDLVVGARFEILEGAKLVGHGEVLRR